MYSLTDAGEGMNYYMLAMAYKKKIYNAPELKVIVMQPSSILDVSTDVRSLNGVFDPDEIDESQKNGDNVYGL